MMTEGSGIESGIASRLVIHGYETLEQLAKEPYSKIAHLQGINSSDMDELERALATRGLKLRDRPKDRAEFYQQIGVYP